MRIRQLIIRAAFCALMVGIANSSFGGFIFNDPNSGLVNDPAANYIYDWNGVFTVVQPLPSALTYGTPQVIGGNVLDFTQNLVFSSVSGGSTPSDFVDGKLTVDIKAKPNQSINGITLNESGTYGFGFDGTSTTAAAVTLTGAKLFITEIGGVAVSDLISGSLLPANFQTAYGGTMIFDPSTPTTQMFQKTTGFAPVAGEWSGSMTIDLSNALNGTSQAGKAITGAMLVFDNQLDTNLGTSTRSFIDKKHVQLTVASVPEPSSLILLGMGAIALAFAWKRR